MFSAKSLDAHDKLVCPECSGQMLLSDNKRHPTILSGEIQTFTCNNCSATMLRNINIGGQTN